MAEHFVNILNRWSKDKEEWTSRYVAGTEAAIHKLERELKIKTLEIENMRLQKQIYDLRLRILWQGADK